MSRRWASIAAGSFWLLGICWSVEWGGDEKKSGARDFAAELREAAKRADEAGVLEEAEFLYYKLYFVDRTNEKVRTKLKAVQKRRSAELLAAAAARGPAEAAKAVELLRQAHRVDPRNPAVKSAFEKRGLEWFAGEWRTEAEIHVYKETDAARGEQRRRELRLDPRFKVIRREPFRFFTDVDLAQGKSVLEQMMTSIQSHYRVYCEVMEPFGLRYPVEGLDVVLMTSEREYVALTNVEGSAGVYIPDNQAGYFYKRSGYDFGTMLHEMTHQLNDKVLGALRLSGWFEEGISEYFGAGYLTQLGARLELGRTDGARLGRFQTAVKGFAGTVHALPKFLDMPYAELTDAFYNQAWATAHYLMEVHPLGRQILYDFIARGKGERTRAAEEMKRKQREAESPTPEEEGKNEPAEEETESEEADRSPGWVDSKDLEAILGQYDLDLTRFEADMMLFYRTGAAGK